MTLSARWLTAVLLAGAVLGACSGRDAAETTPPEPTNEATSAGALHPPAA
jgi:hypothetical protein